MRLPPRELAGRPAASGVAVGPIARLADQPRDAPPRGTPAQEAASLHRAIAAATAELTALAGRQDDEDAAGIIGFQIAMLEDDSLAAPAFAAIGDGAAIAWQRALAAQIADYDSAADEYFRARAADLADLADRVARHLAGTADAPAAPGAIVIGEDLTPSRFLERDWTGGGIALAAGSPTSHVAMLARARGVPMVVGLGAIDWDGHSVAAIDGAAGRVVLSPDPSRFARTRAEAIDPALLRAPAVTACGTPIRVLLNIAAAAELDRIDPAMCDGIGLVRTELLFPADAALADEDTQFAIYRRIVEWAAGRPVTIRTLDAGGDKPIPGLTDLGESNPFLGRRGLRLSLVHPDIFTVQLRALTRAAVHGPLKIMLPMVTTPRELEAARALLPPRAPPLGMMVEVPAAALSIARFDAAFFSIGSNDLTQYVTAAARDIASVADLADPADPGVLRLIAEVAAHGAATGREVSVCGDMAGDPAHLRALLDAGVRTLSMAANAVGPVKAAIAAIRIGS